MHFRISHQLRYHYDRPVFFEPTLVRLCPRHDPVQHLLDFDVQLSPTPAGSTPILDIHDNCASVYWFNDTHEQMQIRSTARVRVLPRSPFDYLHASRG